MAASRTIRFMWRSRQYRAELHDRLATPLYPLAFVIVAFAFLGPPQTTRQSRTLAFLGMVGAVSLLRLIGFVSVIVGVHVPGMLAVQYRRAFGAIARRPVADLARAGRRAGRRRCRKIATAIGERIARATRVEERADAHRHAVPLLRHRAFSNPSSARSSAWSRSPR